MSSEPNFDGRKATPFDFKDRDIRIPAGTRIFSIVGKPVIVPGPDGSTRIFLHPDDVATVVAANA